MCGRYLAPSMTDAPFAVRAIHSASRLNGTVGGRGPDWRSVSPSLVVERRRRIRKLIHQLRKIYGHLWPQLPPGHGLPLDPVGV
jgi:hypothetical protein